jgi:phytoene dehydrogenase-like protein
MTDSNRVVIIGAGHNGLVCAAYLAKAGRDVVVLEAAEQIGGAAVTTEFAPGFKVSACAHLLNLLDNRISHDLGLESLGLNLARTDLATVALATDGEHLTYTGSEVSGGGLSAVDQTAFIEYQRRMNRFAALLGRLHNVIPPRLATSNRTDLISSAKLVLDIRRLGKKDMREFLRIAGINIFDILEESFDNALLKGALSLDGVLGTNLGPRSNNSVYAAMYRRSGKVGGGRQGALALPSGGMGAVTDAMAAAARQHGATIRTASPVTQILLDGDRVSGVELADGERVDAGTVVSNADPQTTFFKLLGARHLEAGFMRRIQHLRTRGKAAKLHLALSGLPEFTGVAPEQSGERLVIAPDLVYVEHAFDHSKYGEHSAEPVLEISIPSVHDKSLAPDGQHVLSAIVQYAPYDLKGGWEASRQTFLDQIMSVLARYAPNIREQVIHSQLLTPVDIETQFRIAGGHWHHGELALDQALMLRPVPGAAQYAAPVDGLYLCGAGCHPGGGVMGSAGRNAATAILAGDVT